MIRHAVAFLLTRDGKALLLACHNEGTYRGRLLPPSGMVGSDTDGNNSRRAAERETFEELGVTVRNLRFVGIVEIPSRNLRLYVYRGQFNGSPTPSNEMRHPCRVPLERVPELIEKGRMWDDASCWVLLALSHPAGAPPFTRRLCRWHNRFYSQVISQPERRRERIRAC
jgi:hypothetical protein